MMRKKCEKIKNYKEKQRLKNNKKFKSIQNFPLFIEDISCLNVLEQVSHFPLIRTIV